MSRRAVLVVAAALAGCKAEPAAHARDGGARAATAAELPAETDRGTLARAPPVRFGGPPYCRYEVELRDVALEARVVADQLAALTLTTRMVESVPEPCPHPPAGPSDHRYAFSGAPMTIGHGVAIALDGQPTNFPPAAATVALRPGGEGLVARVSWKRIDQAAPLDWMVTAEVTLTRDAR